MVKLRTALALAVSLLFAAAALADPSDSNPRVTPVVKAARLAAPAVVNITSARIAERGLDSFDLFLGDSGYFSQPGGRERGREESLGSGVIIDGRGGLVLTNAHVISGATEITVRLQDGREFKAGLAASDPDFDLAVLRLAKASGLPEIRMGDSSDLMIGETVIAIGNPYGYSHTLTTGVVSALGRSIRTQDGAFTDLIQTDAAINPGNSGGPLLNINGELIGINTAIHAGAEGIGFAIPVAKAKRVVAELESAGHVRAAWLGLSGQSLDARTARHLGLDKPRGMVITEIYEGQSAAKAGLMPGDVIVSVDSVAIEDREHFVDLLRNSTVGETVKLGIWRGGARTAVSLETAEFTLDAARAVVLERWGMELSIERGAVKIVTLRPGSAAQKVGLAPGDRLIQIGGARLREPSDFVQGVLRYRMHNTVILMIERAGRQYYAKFSV
ncbi:MAG: trypsin-like peptidase domain-containing protein [Desulfovibrionaceae bacterium]|nr:trypsin-like peptidase domain-containing protein [Desulfovibrionaceae bacterium]MBF0513611.1 trypsin-like peptidase domain-containing protein [Desulfovibrionaceae bacterium]